MADNSKNKDDSLRWREKYFTLSEELEKNEKDYASYLNVLHRALVRISLAADGQDSELDKHLSSLRNMLRKEPVSQANINSNLTQVESAILRLDTQRKDTGNQGLESLQALVNQLSQLKLSKDNQRALKHYSKSLAAKSDQLSSYPALLEEYSRLQQAALTESFNAATDTSSTHEKNTSKGLLSRMFGGKPEQPTVAIEEKPATDTSSSSIDTFSETAAATNTEETVPAPLELVSEKKLDTKNTSDETAPVADYDEKHATRSASEDSSDQNESFETIINVLADLLEQLPLSPDTRDQAQLLRNQLSELAAAGEWDRVVDGTAELVIQALDKSQQEFEHFLLTLDQQLSQINSFLGCQGQHESARKNSTKQLSTLVRCQVGSISKAVGEASDINNLKASVQDQLKTIVGSMDEFIETESQREQALEQQLEVMREQLTVVQTESQSIRKKLHTETLRALTDTLTRLPNREAFNERFTLERERFLRYKHPASMAILDIDHFKLVNDNHGHLVGDRVLQAFAAKVNEMIRSTDFLARYGGEEFILIMPETDTNAAHTLLEKIREGVAHMQPKSLGILNPITVSAGLAAFQLGEKADDLVERTDKALYQAKDNGRNRIVIAE